MTPKYLSPKQVAEELGISTETMWRYLRDGSIPGVVRLPSGCYRIPVDYIERMKGEK